ncbi:MAG: enolase C-terminal domain-like protein [Planctomycetota bacterium]
MFICEHQPAPAPGRGGAQPEPRSLAVTRRELLGATAALGAAGGLAPRSTANRGRDGDSPLASGQRIRRVAYAYLEAPRWKTVGRNSQLGLHGDAAGDGIMRIETDAGAIGVGQTWTGEAEAGRALLGADPLSFYRPGAGVESPLGRFDWPLWDLVARILDVPLWRLFGGYGPEWVPVYDGSIYFTDLEEEALRPAELGTGIPRVLKEVERALERGHRAFKIKVGRGNRWMSDREAGLRRDIEVVRAIRQLVGPSVRFMVDANDGYDLATTKRFLEGAEDDFFFVEEMFPEEIDQDLALKAWMKSRRWKTLLADGESADEVDHFRPYIEARAMDVLQPDMRGLGFARMLELARMTAQTGILVNPRNWGSCLGLPMQLQLARGIPNFGLAEEDPGLLPYFEYPGYVPREGRMSVPDTPGSGLLFHEDRFLAERAYDWVVEP